MFWLIIIISLLSILIFIKKKNPVFLTVPLLTLFIYFLVLVLMVPLGFIDTIKFIFGLG